MRIAAALLTILTAFPITGLVAGLFLFLGVVGGITDVFSQEHRDGALAVLIWSIAGLWGVLSAAEALLHFLQWPDDKLGHWQVRRVICGLLAGCGACAWLGTFGPEAIFLTIIITLPLVVLALSLLAMIAFRQADVV